MKLAWDIEANNLLNEETIDYTSVPYKLKPNFKMHVITAIVDGRVFCFYDGATIVLDGSRKASVVDGVEYVLEEGYEPIPYVHRPLSAFPAFVSWIKEDAVVIAHNQIDYDLLAVKLYYGIDYAVEKDMSVGSPIGDDYWGGKKVIFDDTLVRSKTLNPDRFGGHSLDNLASGGEYEKIKFRHHLPFAERFKHFGPDMLYYNIVDVKANLQVAAKLDEEMQAFDWGTKWEKAIKLEKAVAELVTRQSHRGFKFDNVLAEKNIAELDILMEERRVKIEAILPEKPATKGFMKDFTPPKIQFKKNGEASAALLKFAEKVGASIDGNKFVFHGEYYDLPLSGEPLVTTCAASINDTTFIKGWLVTLEWLPSEYKERDLTIDTRKIKLSKEKLEESFERYSEQTAYSPFAKDRCEHLGISLRKNETPESIKQRLLTVLHKRAERKGSIKVLTNPSFTVGQEKEICPHLQALADSNEQYACILDIVEYLTYRHRRNSILGGGAEWDEDEEPEKGYVSAVRSDGRIPTPADTCGAATSRMKHRVVANIPRVTSLYGDKMRGLFGVDEDCYQVGYDFDSLEAREEANFCWDFEQGDDKEYCNSLLMDKPNDVHTRMAQKISEIIGREFARGPAKSVKYGATYGAQAAKVAKTIGSDLATGQIVFDAFWAAAAPLANLKKSLQMEWEDFGKKKIIGIDGRLVPTRSAHAILNSKFQSSGVICAKRAMVLHDRKMREENLVVDFFKDSLEGREWGQQLIAYHK